MMVSYFSEVFRTNDSHIFLFYIYLSLEIWVSGAVLGPVTLFLAAVAAGVPIFVGRCLLLLLVHVIILVLFRNVL
jgi:hypothetical protein